MFKGTVISQIFGFISALFLAKIYGSESFGIFGIYISISSILSILNTLQLDRVIIVSNKLNKRISLMNSLFIIVILTGIFSIILYYTLDVFFNLKLINTTPFFIIILASVLFSFIKIHESFLTSVKCFKPISKTKILIVIFNFIFQFVLFYKFKIYGLVYGSLISLFLITIYYFIINKRFTYLTITDKFWNKISSNKTIIKYLLPSNLINSLATNLMPVLILSFFSLKVAGIYFFSLKILATPLTLISSSVSEVYFQKSSSMFLNKAKGKLYKLTKELVLTNLSLMLMFIIVINTFGIYFFELLFNKNWDNLRLYIFILSFLILARSSFNPISNIIVVLNKNHIGLIFNIYLLIINLIAICVGFLNSNFIYTMIFLSLFGSIGYLILLLYFLQLLKNKS